MSTGETLHTFLSPVAHWVNNLPATQETEETQAGTLGQEGPLEEEVGAHSCILA